MVTAALELWLAAGLAAILIAGAAASPLLLAMGRLSLDLGWGRRHWVRPQWERVVGEHLTALKANAERLGSRSAR